ncbi:GBF-interacting protein 1 [Mucuna pruriens]|uniref:GBF-interacting protein 1 n=1 Tax=Mucuna pruriens TaxID=157652 RepID=A0A371HZ70_MUCPR|nr:GBF-interacting protein 1 [Mucuna pruriens]
MSGGGGSSCFRVPIPNNVRKIIHDIREITGKQHTDDEIYAVLRECSMDPNETAQKLLYLDTFHEVRRRRDRKKEGLGNRASEESRLKQGGQGRGGRGASGGYSSNFPGTVSSSFIDGGGGRNLANRRENGVNHIAERSHALSTQPVLQKTKTNTTSQATRVSAVAPHGAANQSNGKSGHGSAGLSPIISVPKSSSAANDTGYQENVQPQAAVVTAASSPTQTSGSVTSTDQGKSLSSSDQLQTSVSGVHSSLDPVVASSVSHNPGVSGAISREVGSIRITAGPNHVKGNKVVVHEVNDLSASKNEKSGSMNSMSKANAPQKSNEVENSRLSEPSQLSSPSSPNDSLRPSSSSGSQPPLANITEVSTSEACVQSSAELRQHVTFPNHFQVPEALKSGLTFGSFDTFGPSEKSNSGTGGDNNASPALESSLGSDEAATSSNQSASLTAQGDHLDYPHSSSYLIEKTPATEGNSITGIDTKIDQPKKEVLLVPESHQIPTVQTAQNYGLNFMTTMLGTQQVQFEGTEPQSQDTSRFSNFVGKIPSYKHTIVAYGAAIVGLVLPSQIAYGGWQKICHTILPWCHHLNASSQAVSPSPTPPLQSSIPVSPQSVSIFRPPYPTNFFPYGHYYPPIYVSPIHQFLSHNGFPQQPSAGNMYLPAAAGIKFPLPQFKAGANAGNAAHIGIPSGSFITPPVGYAPSPTVNTGSSTGNDDLAVSQLKESQIYTTGQLSEGSAVWIPAPGQDISGLQVNSLYNLGPHGHVTFPQTQGASHGGAFAGIYQAGQAVASPPSTLLQQSQAVAGPVETVGPPSGSYQQPQPAQINWNSNF